MTNAQLAFLICQGWMMVGTLHQANDRMRCLCYSAVFLVLSLFV